MSRPAADAAVGPARREGDEVRLRLSIVDPAGDGRVRDVDVTAAAGTTMAGAASALLRGTGHDDGLALFADGSRLQDDAVLGQAPLLDGGVLTVGRPGGIAGRASGGIGGFLELHAVGGPDAGRVHRLEPGRHRIGRAGEGVLRFDDPDLSRAHAELVVSSAGVTLADSGSTNGTHVDGRPVDREPVLVTERSRVLMGSTTLLLRVPHGDRAASCVDDGLVMVNRSPRIGATVPVVGLELPTPPAPRRTPRFPVVAMLVPLVLAVPLALVLRSPYALLIGLFSPLMIAGNLVSDRITGGREHREAVAAHEDATAQVQADLDEALRLEVLRRRAAAPDAAELLQTATDVQPRIWERRPADSDFLELRVGTATLSSQVTVHDRAAGRSVVRRPTVDDVPMTVPLAQLGVMGTAGHRPRVLALVRSLLGQLAVLHSPRHLSLVVLVAEPAEGQVPATADEFARYAGPRTGAAPGAEWAWTAWLPHLEPVPTSGLGQGCAALVGVSEDQVRRRVAELVALLDARLDAQGAAQVTGDSRRERHVYERHVVVVLDGAQRLRAVPGVARLLEHGREAGIHVLCLDDVAARLPVECRATVVVGGEVATRLRVVAQESEPVDDVVADLVSDRWARQLARGVAPLRDATPQLTTGLPTGVRLLDALDVDATDPEQLAATWRRRPRSTSVLLGTAAGGRFVVDLRRDGPHALVAGTTGSGKSELLQTLVAGLAVANRPDELVFVLVDYKGGAAFAECARLPHTVGLVTDLDAALTARALESLGAEVARREELLARHGASDLDDYQRRRTSAHRDPANPPMPPLPRLVLVVDEFRVLAEELPDFIAGLVRLAAVGRSLGVHLVLATQRPAGVVSADIKANVNLRIALRVQDAADSLDVVDVAHAAAIDAATPGRALARVGSAAPVLFQAARVGGVPPDAQADLCVRELVWERLGSPGMPSDGQPETTSPTHFPGGGAETDLARLVAAVTAAATELGATPVPSPWLPALPAVLTREALTQLATEATSNAGLTLHYGLLDDPARQRQVVAGWDLDAAGPLGVVGSTRSGRSTTVRALMASLAEQCAPHDAWAYVLDGGGALTGLADLPHVGAVVPRDDTERAGRVLQRLVREVARRQELLSRHSVADLAEQRAAAAPGEALPWVVLAVDGWESLQQHWDDAEGLRCVDALHQLLRQGPGVGVLTLITGGRAVATGQIGALVGQRLVLRTSDPGDAVMAGVPSRALPSTWPPGRAVLVGAPADEPPRQVQVALLAAETSGAAQHAAMVVIARQADGASHHGTVPPVPPMPHRVDLSPLLEAALPLGGTPPAGTPPAGTSEAARSELMVLGVGGDDVSPLGFDPTVHGPVQLVAGHPGSGRSTALVVLAEGARRAGRPVVAVVPRRSPLSDVMDPEQPRSTAETVVLGPDAAVELTSTLERFRADGRPALVLVDDVESLDGCPVEPVLARLLTTAASTGEVVVGAGSTPDLLARFQGLGMQLRRPGSGLVLGPAGPTDGDVLGVRLPRRTVRLRGRGVLVHRGAVTMVQVALPHPADPHDPVHRPTPRQGQHLSPDPQETS